MLFDTNTKNYDFYSLSFIGMCFKTSKVQNNLLFIKLSTIIRNMKYLSCTVTCLCVSLAFADTYRVVRGDTLSQIAQRHMRRPVYGANGSLQALLDQNSSITNPDLIYPGQIISFSSGKEDIKVKASAVMTPDVDPTSEKPQSEVLQSKVPKEKSTISRLSFHPIFNYSRLDSDLPRGVSATALSDLGMGIRAQWELPLNKKLSFVLSGKYLQQEFEVSENKELEESSIQTNYLAAGLEFQLQQDWRLSSQAGYQVTTLLRAKDTETLTIDSLKGAFISFDPQYKIWSNHDVTLYGSVPLKYSFAAESSGESTTGGLGYGLGFEATQDLNNGRIIGTTTIFNDTNELGSISSENKYFEVSVGYEFFLGGS